MANTTEGQNTNIKCHYVREKVGDGIINFKHFSTNQMLADMHTKQHLLQYF